jgi:hypothetical protein
MQMEGHTGAPAGPAAKKCQPWFPGRAPGAFFRLWYMAGVAGGGGWGCNQPPASLPGWSYGAAPPTSIRLPLPVIGEILWSDWGTT